MPGVCGHRVDQRRRAGAVARVEHGRPVHGPHHRQVLERHLRRAVGADLHPRVRARQPQVDAGDRAHPDEVVGAGEEGGEGGRERAVPAHGQPGGRGHQLLLGDEHLEVAVGEDVRELVGEGRVADLAVQRDHLRVPGAEGDQRVAVGLPGGDRRADLVHRRRSARPGRRAGGCATVVGLSGTGPGSAGSGFGPRSTRLRTPPSSAIARSAMSGGNGLPCQPFLFSTSEKPLPLIVLARITVGWLPAGVRRERHRLVDGGEVVPVDRQHPGAERLHPARVLRQVPAEVGRAALAEPVDVGDHDQVRQLVVGGLVERLPDGALGQLAVPAQHPDPVREPVQVPARQRDPDAVGQPLAERAGGDVDPRQDGAWGGPPAAGRTAGSRSSARLPRRPRPP